MFIYLIIKTYAKLKNLCLLCLNVPKNPYKSLENIEKYVKIPKSYVFLLGY